MIRLWKNTQAVLGRARHSVPATAVWKTSPFLLVLLAAGCAEPARVERSLEALGATATVEVYGATARVADEAAADIERAIRRAEQLFGTTDPDSGLNRLNARAGIQAFPTGDADLYRCVKVALDWAKASGGAFDPTVGLLVRIHAGEGGPPAAAEVAEALRHTGWRKVKKYREARAIRFLDPEMQLDLGGIHEGYALDIAARNFALVGVRAGMLTLGGVVYAWEPPPGSTGWRVAIGDRSGGPTVAKLELSHRALSVSGRFGAPRDDGSAAPRPTLDPATGFPPAGDVLAAVAIADSAADADAISTALLVMGVQRAAAMLERTRRVEALLLVRDTEGTYLLVSASLRGRLELDPGFEATLAGSVRYLLPPASFPE